MARPVVHPVVEEIHQGLGPWAEPDESQDFALLRFIAAVTPTLTALDDLVRDSAGGPGWSSLLDPDRTRRDRLPYLAQFVGVDIPPGLSEANERAAVKGMVGFARGTVESIAGAVQPFLTGSRVVQIIERDGSAYHLTVRTFARETPNESRARAALMNAKPAGLILTYEVFAGQTYGELKATEKTYAELGESYPSYYEMTTSVPAP